MWIEADIFFVSPQRYPRPSLIYPAISSNLSTTGWINGIPSLLLIASASRSGSPGISGPLVPEAGLVLRKTRIHSSICFFEFVFVDEAVDLQGAEKVADVFTGVLRRDFFPQRKRLAAAITCKIDVQKSGPKES